MIDQKLIKAPFAGELGLRQVELGQYVEPGDTLVTLTDLDQLYANFTLPEQDRALGRGRAAGRAARRRLSRARCSRRKLTAIEPQIDPTTRVMRLQATLANPEAPAAARHVRQRPASCCRRVPDVVSVPETAVDRTLYGDSVFVVREDGKDADGKPKHKAVQTFVETGAHFDGRVAITRGVAAGDVVVASGQLKLQNGAPVHGRRRRRWQRPRPPPVQ